MHLVEDINLNNPRIGNHPELIHPPAYPFLLSIGFKIYELLNVDPFSMSLGTRILPAERWIIIPLNHIFTILTGLLVFSIGKNLFIAKLDSYP